jgi:hypothetical protein
LPSYVDDVIEGYISNDKKTFYSDSAKTKTISAETGKIYLDIPSLKTYRWGGSTYAEISESLALGETATTAYYGDKGKVAYDHSQSSHAPSDAEKNVQSDWNETDTNSDAFIKNKPTIPTVYDSKITLSAGDGLTTGGDFTLNQASDKTITFNVGAGEGITVNADNVAHSVPTGASATSYGPSAGGEQTAKGTLDIIVPQITTDKFGHITGVTNKTFKVTDTDTNSAHSHSAGVGLLLGDTNTGGTSGTVAYKAALVNETKSSNAASYTAGGSSKFYAVQLDKDGKLAVYVPWDANTDTKVKQSNTTTAKWRKVVLSAQEDTNAGTAVTEKTDQVYVTPGIEVQSSTGNLRASGEVQMNKLKITSTDMINHIEFARNSWNYIVASGGSSAAFGFVAGGKSASGANSTLAIYGDKFIPGQRDN